MLLMIDNFDSFTYNLVQYFGELGIDVVVRRNDAIGVEDAKLLNPSQLVVSPGPGVPNRAGNSLRLIEAFAGKIPILGVCLGHQCIGQVFGAKIVSAQKLMHGKTSMVLHKSAGLFEQIVSPLKVARYHSLAIEPDSLSDDLRVTASTEDGEIMAIEHKHWPLWGVQFHPESCATDQGLKLLDNFLRI